MCWEACAARLSGWEMLPHKADDLLLSLKCRDLHALGFAGGSIRSPILKKTHSLSSHPFYVPVSSLRGQVTSQEPFLTTGSFPGASPNLEPRLIFHFLEHNYCSPKWWRGITLTLEFSVLSGTNWPNKSLLTFTTGEQLFLRLFRQEYTDSSQEDLSRSGRVPTHLF